MIVPTWLIVVGCLLLYALVGVAHAVVMAYRAGRRGRSGPDGCDGLMVMLGWPFCDVINLFIWSIEKYGDFLHAVRVRGEESVMPLENEHPGRRVEEGRR